MSQEMERDSAWTVTDQVRRSCAAFDSPLVQIDPDRLGAFADGIDLGAVDVFVHSSDGMSTNRFDDVIAFPSWTDEAGFLVIAHGVDFGSGFRPLLHKHRDGLGAWLTIRSGLVQMGQANPTFAAAWLATLTVSDVQRLFDLCRTDEAASDLLPLAEQLCTVIHEFGTQLSRLGFATPGEYFVHRLRDSDASAVRLVAHLVHDFPVTFNDSYTVDRAPGVVCFYKKAQLVVSEVYMRFAATELSQVTDIDGLTAFVDNVVVAMMRMTGILTVEDALASLINREEPIAKGSEAEIALRAKALDAVEQVVARVNATQGRQPAVLNAQRLCNWLWGCLGKAPGNRQFPRHLTPSTSFY
eukprot:gene4666-3345_t